MMMSLFGTHLRLLISILLYKANPSGRGTQVLAGEPLDDEKRHMKFSDDDRRLFVCLLVVGTDSRLLHVRVFLRG